MTSQFKSDLINALLVNAFYVALVVSGCLVWFGVITKQL